MENKEEEIWVDVIGYDRLYMISSHGRTKRVEGTNGRIERILKNGKDKDGYTLAVFCKNGISKTYKVHRLVGIHFIPNPYKLPEINHKYGDKTNNYYKDLEWSTRRDNSIHALRTGLRPYTTEKQIAAVKKNNLLKRKKVYQFSLQREYVKEYDSITIAAKLNKLDNGNIGKCCNGIYAKCGNYIWSYNKNI